MSVSEIENAIKSLPKQDLSKLQRWFEEYLADQWDEKIASDAQAGKLDFLIEQADEADNSGTLRQFDP